MTDTLVTHEDLQAEYEIALRLWSEVRGLNKADSSDVFDATALLEELEGKLREYPVKLLASPQN